MTKSHRILFVDWERRLHDLIIEANAVGLTVFTANDSQTARFLIDTESPELVFLDGDASHGELLCPERLNLLSEIDAPCVVLTSAEDDDSGRQIADSGARRLTKGCGARAQLREILSERFGTDLDNSDRSQEVTELVFEMLGSYEPFLEFPLIDSQEEIQTAASRTSASSWVLCVEDDRDFSLALQLRLQQYGISVIRAFEGVEGINVALTQPATAILLDYNLPNGRGDAVLKCLKSNPTTRDIPVIAISGQKRPGLEKEMLHLGAERFFSKPVRFDELIDELRKHVPVDNGACEQS